MAFATFPLAISLLHGCGGPDTGSPPDTDAADTDGDTDPETDTEPETDVETDETDETDVDSDPVDTDDTDPPDDTDTGPSSVTFAVIGDFGVDGAYEADVADLVHSYAPDFIVTTGDNNYGPGDAAAYDDSVGKYYYDYIHPYAGVYGVGAADNAFFPSLGNHDWDGDDASGYLDFFELPGTEYYYDFVRGDVHFFMLDSDPREPDGIRPTSLQAAWLQAALAVSSSAWQVVIFHHPAFSSSDHHGSTEDMQWPFGVWGADLVMSGHDHVYERLDVAGVTYLVNGIGGSGLYGFRDIGPLPESIVQFDSEHGAVFASASSSDFEVTAVTASGVVVDHFWLGEPEPAFETLLPAGSPWVALDDGSDPGPTWISASFDDSRWTGGDAPLGFNTDDLNTILAGATDLAARPTTTWFRATFDVTDPAAWHALRLGLVRDDGAIVYLNGAEVLRSNLPPLGVSPGSPALRRVDGGSENVRQTAWIPASTLVPGTNIVAVEVHQHGSPVDLKLDLQIDAL